MRGYVIALQSVIEVPGERNELGYTLYMNSPVFDNEKDAMAAISEVGLPLGWVVISLATLLSL